MHVQASKPLLKMSGAALTEGELDACEVKKLKKEDGGACPLKSSLAGVSARARQVAKAMERNCCSVKYALEQASRVNVSSPVSTGATTTLSRHTAIHLSPHGQCPSPSHNQHVGTRQFAHHNKLAGYECPAPNAWAVYACATCTTLVHLHSFYHRVYAF